jgi:hypothetical protein
MSYQVLLHPALSESLTPEALGALTRAALESNCEIHPNPADFVTREDLYLRLGRKSGVKPGVFLFVDGYGLKELLLTHNTLDGTGIVLVQSEKDSPNLSEIAFKVPKLRFILGWPQQDFAYTIARSILRNEPITQSIWHDANHSQIVFTLSSSEERSKIQEHVKGFFQDELLKHNQTPLGGVANYSKYLADVCDEFLMNAIWDAAPTRKSFDRTLSIPIPKNERIEVKCQSDGRNLALTVQDNHGTFPESALCKVIRYALGSKEDAVVNEGPGGAGLGLFMVLQKVAALCYEVTPGVCTKAMAVLRTDRSLKQMQKTLRTIAYTQKD